MNKVKTRIITIIVLFGIATNSIAQNTNKMKQKNVQHNNIERIDVLFNFENDNDGEVPSGFSTTTTGMPTSIKWSIVNDNGNNVVAQQAINSGSCYNLLVHEKVRFDNFSAEVKIKAVSGHEDQGGGLVWRFIDSNNYYIARYNPLENNLRLYHVVDGSRKQLQSADSDIEQGEWYTLAIEMKNNSIICSINGKYLIETKDDTFKSSGLFGFWTKADAITYFDDLSIIPLK